MLTGHLAANNAKDKIEGAIAAVHSKQQTVMQQYHECYFPNVYAGHQQNTQQQCTCNAAANLINAGKLATEKLDALPDCLLALPTLSTYCVPSITPWLQS